MKTFEELMLQVSDLEDRVIELTKTVEFQQAKIDSLMLEFCPEEMTAEQFEVWAAHQQPVSLEETKKIDAAISDFLAQTS